MQHGRDLFTSIKVAKAITSGLQLTADNAAQPVVDLRDEKPGAIVAFLVHLQTVATADGSNLFKASIFEADEKTSSTALTAGAKAADDDVLGPAKDGALADEANPKKNEILVNATTLEGSTFMLQYRGYKNCVQLQFDETGTADITVTVIPLISSGDTENVKASIVH